MQPRVQSTVAKIDDLIVRLDQHIRLKLAGTMDLSDGDRVEHALTKLHDTRCHAGESSGKLDERHSGTPSTPNGCAGSTQLLAKAETSALAIHGRDRRGAGRASMGIINSTGCTSVWGSTYPFNPYPFPWANHLFQDSPSMAMGIFEGHMAKMADGFKAVRMAEIELNGGYNKEKHGDFFTYFNWKQFTDEEFRLCPPVVSIGGDGAMYDIGFQNLSRMMMSGKPIKVLILDTQVYSNTGGQACTSGLHRPGFRHGAVRQGAQGKEEVRKEIALIAHGAPHHLCGAGQHLQRHASDRELHRRHQCAAAGAVQYLQPLHAGTRHCGRSGGAPEQARGGIARLSADPLQPR